MELRPLMDGDIEQARRCVPDADEILETLRPWLSKPIETWTLASVYFDGDHPILPFGAHLRAMRRWKSGKSGRKSPYVLVYKPRAESPNQVCPFPVTLGSAAKVASEYFGLPLLKPKFGVRYTRTHYDAGPLRVTVVRDVSYHSIQGRPLRIGEERSARIGLQRRDLTQSEPLPKKMRKVLNKLPTVHQSSMKWMGYYLYSKCFEAPRFNELPGFEYEVKLSTPTLDVDPAVLPLPLLEVRQTESVRQYLDGVRAAIVDGAATLVDKGKVKALDGGVLMRPEAKVRGVSAFLLDETKPWMRRFKRSVNVLQPETLRVYTISLHHCVAEETLQQVELEYDGTLVPGTVGPMKRFEASSDPAFLAETAEAIEAAGRPALARDTWSRLVRVTTGADREEAERRVARLEGQVDPQPDGSADKAVCGDLRMLRDALVDHYGMSESRLTKRQWLKTKGQRK